LGKSRFGIEVRVFLPSDIPGLIPKLTELGNIDLTLIDFFSIDENRMKILTEIHGDVVTV
jgi:hypothetical protein